MKPNCFVLMPYGKKPGANGNTVHFDTIYLKIIKLAIEDANLEPIREDEEKFGGIMHKSVFERLMMCEYAVADITNANANVFYELGRRDGMRPHSTTLIFSKDSRLQFDGSPFQVMPYTLDKYGHLVSIESDKKNLTQLLIRSQIETNDSPVYQLIHDMNGTDIQRLKTDTFRYTVEYEEETKNLITSARADGINALKALQASFEITDTSPSILIDLLLSYRAIKSWQSMVDLVSDFPAPLSNTIMANEQLGFALNRLERHHEAEKILKALISDYGPSSETNGILGRVYKDQWEKAVLDSNPAAPGYLTKAINTYLEGFEVDWRDAYPGINAVTLMEMQDTVDHRQHEILPVVRYSVERRLNSNKADYWDYVTLLQLAILSNNQVDAESLVEKCLAEIRESWEPETTARNINLICKKRKAQNKENEWIHSIEKKLLQHS